MIDIDKVPSPCYVMDEKLLRKNLSLIKSVADKAGVEIILAFKCGSHFPFSESISDIQLPVRFMKRVWLMKSLGAKHILILLHIPKPIFLLS